MALVICPDCEKEVSDQAEQCIHCGRPMGAPMAMAYEDEVQIIEQTGKKWKMMKVWSVLAFLGGGLLLMMGGSAEIAFFSAIGMALILGSIGLYIASRWGAWWYHK